MKSRLLLLFFCFLTYAGFGQNYIGDKKEIKKILKNAEAFSKAVVSGNTEGLVKAYTADAKLFPTNRDILSGTDSVRAYWSFSGPSAISYHKLTPIEIKISGDEARDYGYYEGTSKLEDGSESHWKGKYLVIWKKVDDDWKMYLDIWNSNPK
jgi:ketosteroid isomerase-like protein